MDDLDIAISTAMARKNRTQGQRDDLEVAIERARATQRQVPKQRAIPAAANKFERLAIEAAKRKKGPSANEYEALARDAAVKKRQNPPTNPGMHPHLYDMQVSSGAELGLPARETSHVGDTGGMSAAALDGAMLGFGDEYLAGLSSVLGVQPDGQGGANWFDYSKPIGERYETALGAIRSEQADFAEANPGKAISGEMAGAIIGPGKGMGQFINAGKTSTVRLGRGGLAGGGSAGAYGFGEGEGGVAERGLSGALNAPIGALGGGALSGAGQGLNRALDRLRSRQGTAEASATVEGIKAAAGKLYEKVDASGVTVQANRIGSLAKSVQSQMKSAGYDPSLHPRVKAVIRRLEDESGPKTLSEMEILRRVASNAAQSPQPDERRLAAKIVDRIDVVTQSVGGGKAGKEARDLWARARRLESIEGAIEKAATFDDFEKALQAQFKILLRNKKAMRGFKPEEIKAIRQVAMGTTPQRAFKALGDTLSINTLSGMGATGAAIALDGGIASVGVPLTGAASRKAANAITRRSAERARTTIAEGKAPPMADNPFALGVSPASAQANEIKKYLSGK